jgi:hypothetical protein
MTLVFCKSHGISKLAKRKLDVEADMTVLENSIQIDASPEAVWRVLGALDTLEQYDPGVKQSRLLDGPSEGIGAARRCDLAPGGWFAERVTDWRPNDSIAFELYECTLPVKRLKHRYKLTAKDGGTLVEQTMEYELKYGPLGALMDALMVRRKWNDGIRGFFTGLKRRVEASTSPPRVASVGEVQVVRPSS